MEVFVIIWIIAALLLVGFYLFLYLPFLLKRRQASDNNPLKPVSIIICARNEEDNLARHLPSILSQEYPEEYEVIVVSDRSRDNTVGILSGMVVKYPNLRVVQHEDETKPQGKKKALARGIELAKYDSLLLTDADCQPAGKNWLRLMSSHLQSKKMVLGYGAYRENKSWVSHIVQWETITTALNYFSLANAGMPYMGVGRNIGYSKGLYKDVNGFEKHLNVLSGDDDLLVNDLMPNTPMALEYRAESFTYSEAPADIFEWCNQKRRHLSTSYFYKWQHKLVLGAYGWAQLSFYLLLPFAILFAAPSVLWTVLGFKFIIQLMVLLMTTQKFGGQRALYLFPFWEAFTIIALGMVHLKNMFQGSKKSW